jgi:hypothetical protein
MARWAVPLWLAAAPLTGCAYYNGMWSAQRLAHDARRMEAKGQQAEARSTWGRAAIKAESVLVHHAHSRWADDALVLQGEALARSGSCAAAMAPLSRALSNVADDALHERAALAAAECALRSNETAAAEWLLVPLLTSTDGSRRSDAEYLAGRAALDHGDAATAADRFASSERPEAATAWIRALAAAGQADRAVALIDSVARRDRDESRWADALGDLGRQAGAGAAADGVDRLVARGRLSEGARARLLIVDGDRLRRAGAIDRAAARYAQVAALVPDSVEGGRARVRMVMVRVSQARGPEDLDSALVQLSHVTTGLGGAALAEARELQQHIAAARSADSSEIGDFHGAELARDTLAAPVLAAALFVRFAVRHPTSLFAPKALIAAAALRSESLDSIRGLLRARYPDSPYTLVFTGQGSPTFQVTEDSLAIALGLSRSVALARGGLSFRVGAPRTGPRGPDLDPLLERTGTVTVRRATPTERRPPASQRRPADRPADRPDDRP